MKYNSIFFTLSLILLSGTAYGNQKITSSLVTGEIESISITGDQNDIFAAGIIKVDGQNIILPRNLLIDLPANRLTVSQIFSEAPEPCKVLNQSGLAKSDTPGCNTLEGDGAIATIQANRQLNGTVIAGIVMIEKAQKSMSGVITYINHDDGYFRLNGDYSFDFGGTVVRVNDPTGRHSIQKGFGCYGGPNCSPDPRYGVDSDNYTFDFATGYPACIPSTQIGDPIFSKRTFGSDSQGRGDAYCPDTNRSSTNTLANNSYYFAPIMLGDHVVVSGNYEDINGDRFFSSYDIQVNQTITTTPGQPDYMTFAEVEVDAPGYEQNRAKALFIGFTTLPDSQLDIFALHVNPFTGENNEKIIGTTVGNPDTVNQGAAVGGFGIFKIHYDIDFLVGSGRLGPCLNLANGGFTSQNGGCAGGFTAPLSEDLGIISPVFREMIGKTRNKRDNTNIGSSFDILGNEAPNGQYLTPVGVGFAEWEEINLNQMWMPFLFEGIPWLLDRRLGPGGCDNTEGSGINCLTVASSTNIMRLDPFPFSGLDPRNQASLLPNRDAMLTYFPFLPTNRLKTPPTFGIVEIPGAPITAPDSYQVFNDSSISLNPLSNDTDQVTGIDRSSIRITSGPIHGQASVNIDGTISYTPAQNYIGIDSINYVVAGNSGIYSAEESIHLDVKQLINPNLAILRAQVRTTRLELEVRGTHALAQNASVSIFTPAGDLIAANIPIDPLTGAWIFRRQISGSFFPLTSVVVRSNYNGVASAIVLQRR